jgi:hypothetical protein
MEYVVALAVAVAVIGLVVWKMKKKSAPAQDGAVGAGGGKPSDENTAQH